MKTENDRASTEQSPCCYFCAWKVASVLHRWNTPRWTKKREQARNDESEWPRREEEEKGIPRTSVANDDDNVSYLVWIAWYGRRRAREATSLIRGRRGWRRSDGWYGARIQQPAQREEQSSFVLSTLSAANEPFLAVFLRSLSAWLSLSLFISFSLSLSVWSASRLDTRQ